LITPYPGAVIQINPTSTDRQALYLKLSAHSFYMLGNRYTQWLFRNSVTNGLGLGSPQRGSWAESVGLWDVYAVACADADIDACSQTTMPVVPVCLYILVRPVSLHFAGPLPICNSSHCLWYVAHTAARLLPWYARALKNSDLRITAPLRPLIFECTLYITHALQP